MAVTPVGNPYVESSDLVANYPGASESLAERIDIVGVNPFADSTARATAIPSPVEGQMASLNNDDKVYRYSGSAWVAVGLPPASATDSIATSQSGNSATYADLATVGPTVTLTTGTKALVIVAARISADFAGSGALVSFAVSGASTVAATDTNSLNSYAQAAGTFLPIYRASVATLVTGLTAGSNTFTMKYKRINTSITYLDRTITVIDMGS